jgi:hypothetical protein
MSSNESMSDKYTKDASDGFLSSVSNIISMPFKLIGGIPSAVTSGVDVRDPLVFIIIKYIFMFVSIVALVIFLVITHENRSYTKENVPLHMGTFLVLLLLNLGLIFTNTPSTSFLYNSYTVGFAVLFLALCVYFFSTNNQMGSEIFSYVSGFGLFIVIVCALAILFYFTSKYLQRMDGVPGFIVQFIFYIPCLLIKFIEFMKKQLNETTSTVFFLYIFLILAILIYVYLPQITQFFMLGGAKIVGAQEDTFNGFNLMLTAIASFFLIALAGINSMFAGIAIFFTMIGTYFVGLQEESFTGFNLLMTSIVSFFVSGAASVAGFFTDTGLNIAGGLSSIAVFCALIIPYLVGIMEEGFNGFNLFISLIAGLILAGVAGMGSVFTAIAMVAILAVGYFAGLKNDTVSGFNILLPVILAFILAGLAGAGSFFASVGASAGSGANAGVAGVSGMAGGEEAAGSSGSSGGGIFSAIKKFGLLQYGIVLLTTFMLVLAYFFFPYISQYFSTRNAVVLLPKTTDIDNEKVVAGSEEWMQRDTAGKRQYNQNFSLSCWIFLNSQPTNYSSYAEETTILEFAEGAPKVTYEYAKNSNDENDKLNIYFTNHEEYYNESITLPIKKQKWNNLVFNYNSQYADVFLNGKLERTLNLANKPPQFDNSQFLVVGANKGLDGAVSNITYYPYPLTKTEVVAMYNIYSVRNPPDYIQ